MANNLRFSLTAKKLRGNNTLEKLSAITVPTPLQVAAGAGTGAYRDYTYNLFNGVSQDTNFKIVPNRSNCTFTSLTPAIHSVDTNGNVTRIADGTTITQVTSGKSSITVKQAIANIPSTVQQQILTGFVSGSLRNTVNTLVAGWISGKTYNATNANHYIGTYPNFQRNPNAPFPAWVFAATSLGFYTPNLGTSAAGQQDPMHLISPRHAVCAKHWASSGGLTASKGVNGNGTTLYWLDLNNVLWSAECVDYSYLLDDVCIVYLRWISGAPSITPYYIMPINYTLYAPVDTVVTGQVMAVNLKANDASGKICTQRVVDSNTVGNVTTYFNQSTIFSQYNAWTSPISGGDSSGPVVVPIVIGGVNYPTLATCLFTPSGGPSYADNPTLINAAMNTIATTYADATVYALQIVPLGTFPTYP